MAGTKSTDPVEIERRREVGRRLGAANRGRKRPDLAERNKSEAMRSITRAMSEEGKARVVEAKTVHGHARKRGERAGTQTYYIWAAIVQRCTNPKNRHWKDYGGRGITVCDRWLTFTNFLADMGEKPDGLSIDRIDNDGPYSPDNCRWADAITQAHNKRPAQYRKLEWRGESRTVTEWAQEIGLRADTIWSRLRHGWTVDEALSIPHGRRRPG